VSTSGLTTKQGKAPKLIQDKEREIYLNRLVYAATESTKIVYDKKSEELDHSGGRDVYYVTVGQIKRTKIVIKNAINQDGTTEARTGESETKIAGKIKLTVLKNKVRQDKEEEQKSEVLSPDQEKEKENISKDEGKITVFDRIHFQGGVFGKARIFDKCFVDQAHAIKYAKQHIHCFQFSKENNKVDDPDFDLQDEEDPVVISQVMDCLVVLAKTAKKRNAAILIPDYMTISGNSKLIETALDFVEFEGPVINVCTEGQAASNEELAGQTYRFKGNPKPTPMGILHNRATHSIQVRNGSYSRVAARLASVIAQPDPKLFDHWEGGKRKDQPTHQANHRVVFVVAGGGAAVMEHMAAAVEENIPIVILQGSKRLCDYLPTLWVKRFSSRFDISAETRKMWADCGYPPQTDPDSKMNLWMRTLVEKGHVNIHPVSSGTHSLSRILQSLQSTDDALLQAMRRYCDYRSSAHNMEVPDFRMLIAKLVLGFATTLCVTIAGAVLEPGELQDILHGRVKFSQVPVPTLLLCAGVLVLPAVLSIIMALQHDYNYVPKILALRYAAALVEQEMFLYRSCTTSYSDQKIMLTANSKSKGDKSTSQDAVDAKDNVPEAGMENQKDAAAVAAEDNLDADTPVDMQAARARRLTEQLIKIGEQVPIFDCPDVQEDEKINEFARLFQSGKKKKSLKDPKTKLKINEIVERLKTLSGVKEVAHHTLDEFESEIKFGQLSGDDYARVRLDVYRERYEDHADSSDWFLLFYKVATYAIGAVSGFLSYMGLEMWVTVSTALLSAFAAFNAYAPMERRVQMLRAAVFALEDIQTQWTAVPSELKIQQEYKDLLIENTEKVLLSVHQKPPDFTRAGDSANHIFPDKKKV